MLGINLYARGSLERGIVIVGVIASEVSDWRSKFRSLYRIEEDQGVMYDIIIYIASFGICCIREMYQ